MGPHHPRAVRHGGDSKLPRELQRGQNLFVPGDGRRDGHSRRAVPGVRLQSQPERLGRAIHEVAPRPAVDVQVDKTGSDVALARVDDGRVGRERAPRSSTSAIRPSRTTIAPRATRSGKTIWPRKTSGGMR